MPFKNAFGRFLRQLRTDQDLTLEELARRVRRHGRGITGAYLSLIESGRKPPPRQPVRTALAKALGVIPEKIEAAARGKLHRPLPEVLRENGADPALVERAEAGKLMLDELGDVFKRIAAPGRALVITHFPDGKAVAAIEEDLK
jgi:transcriptional regulator with XRE-family HTH domain